MVPRQLVMRMSSGSSKPYEQAPAGEMHRQASMSAAVRAVGVVSVGGGTCLHPCPSRPSRARRGA